MGFLLTLGVWAALWLIQYGIRKMNEPDDPKIQELAKIPRTEEGVPVPWAFGRVEIAAPNIIWFGAEKAMRRSNPDDTEEVLYYAMAQFGLTLSNIDVDDTSSDCEARLLNIRADEIASVAGSWHWAYTSGPPLAGYPGLSAWTVRVPMPDRGGFSGVVEFNAGRWDCDIGPYAQSMGITQGDFVGLDMNYVPAYQGTVTAFLGNQSGTEATGGSRWFFGKNPNPPTVAFEIVNPVKIPGVAMGLMEYTDGDANPAGVLWKILTKGWGGLARDPATLDVDSFASAALTLFLELNGASGIIYRGETAESLMSRICDQVEGLVYYDPQSLLVKFELIRDDYSIPGLPELDIDSLSSKPEFVTTTYADTSNLVRVKFTNREKGYKEDEVIVFDQANFEVTGRVKPYNVDMPWVTNKDNAARIASRILKTVALPLAKVKFGVTRSVVFWTPAKVFKYRHPTNDKVFIMRVQRIDTGSSKSGEVVVDAIQDHFSFGITVVDPPDATFDAVAMPPTPVADDDVNMAPRWLLLRDALLNNGPDPDAIRLMYLARPGANVSGYRGYVTNAGVLAADTPVVSFLGTATVLTAYARELDPFDGATGIEITNVLNWTLTTATDQQIRALGLNLVQIGVGDTAEILAFRSSTDLGGGTIRLDFIHRALLDTVARDHEPGEPVFLLDLRTTTLLDRQVLQRVGHTGLSAGDTVTAKLAPSTMGSAPDLDEVAEVELTVSPRPSLPAPAVNLQCSSGKVLRARTALVYTNGVVEDEGIDLSWIRRDRLSDNIVLGSDADHPSPEADVTYSIVLTRDGDEEVEVVSGLDDVEYEDLATAIAGHGDMVVAVRTRRDDGDEVLDSWQDPFFEGVFKPWRNLALNPGLQRAGATSKAKWEEITGTMSVGTNGTGPLLDKNYVLGTFGDDPTEFRQRIDVRGYRPARMRALLKFKIKNQLSDTNDTIAVDFNSLDDANATLDTDALAATAASTSQWDGQVLEILELAPTTRSLELAVTLDELLPLVVPDEPAASIADVQVHLGQFSDELLLNASLAGTTSWTTAAGGWFTRSTNGVEGMQSVQTNAANSILTQTVALPDGYLFGEAVFSVAVRAESGTLAQPDIIVEALDGGGATLATMTRPAIILDTGWHRAVVYCDVPYGTEDLRVSLSAADSGSRFDDASLRVHKYLAPRYSLTMDFSAPNHQLLPASPYLWVRDYPNLPLPSVGLFPGVGIGALRIEPQVLVGTDVRAAAVYLPDRHDAFEFREGDPDVVRIRSDASYANFDAATSFTVRIVFAAHTDLTSYGLCGRLGATGWEMDVASGAARCRLVGASATKTATDTSVNRGGLTFVALVYDSIGQTLRCVTPTSSTSVSTVGMGEITCDGIPFCIGDASMTSPVVMTGIVASVELWNQTVSHADLQAAWTWGQRTWAGGYSMTEPPIPAACAACVIGEDEDGQVLGEFQAGSDGVWALVNGETVLPCSPSRTNLVDPNPIHTTGWANDGSPVPTVTLSAARGPNGRWEVVRIEGTDLSWRQLAVTMTNTKPLHVSFMARRVTTPGNGVFRVLEAGGDPCCAPIPFALTTAWQRIDLYNITLDPGFTPGLVVWYPDDGAASGPVEMDLAGPIWVDQDEDNFAPPIAIPTIDGGDAVSYATLEGVDLDVQYKHEGEIEVVAITLRPNVEPGGFCRLDPTGAGGDDPIGLYTDNDAVAFSHKDGAGVEELSATTEAADWDEVRTVRGRWNRTGLLDDSSVFAGVVTDAGSDHQRTAVWTPDPEHFDTITVGHDGSRKFNGGLIRLTVRARETILPATLPSP